MPFIFETTRDRFEEVVFTEYFVHGIKRNEQGYLIPKNKLTKKELLIRDSDGNYSREEISAMWMGWNLACKELRT